jgi:hypothetical protein
VLRLSKGAFDLSDRNADEAIVGGVLDVDQLAELSRRLLPAGRDLAQEDLGVVVVVGARSTPKR